MDNAQLNIIINAKNKTKAAFKDVESKLGRFRKSLKDTGQRLQGLSRKFAPFGIAAAGALAGAGKAAVDFEKRLANVSTLMSGDSTKAVAKLKKNVRGLARELGQSHNALATSAYSIYSAGISDATEAQTTLRESTNLSIAGLGSLEESTDLMTSALNAFSSENLGAEQTAALLFNAVKNGKTTVSELAQGFGQVAPLMNVLGVSFEEFTNVVSAATTVGQKASDVYVRVQAGLTGLMKPTGDLEDVFKELSVTTGEELIASQGGLVNALEAVKKKSKEMGFEMSDVFGNVRAIQILALTETENFKETFAAASDANVDKIHQYREAIQKQKETTAFAIGVMKASITDLAITLGDILRPAIEFVSRAVSALANWLNDDASPAMRILVIAILGVLVVLPPLILGLGLVASAAAAITWPITIATLAIVAFIVQVAFAAWAINKYWPEIVAVSDWAFANVEYAISKVTNSLKTQYAVALGIAKATAALLTGNIAGARKAIRQSRSEVTRLALEAPRKRAVGSTSNLRTELGRINISRYKAQDKRSLMEQATSALAGTAGGTDFEALAAGVDTGAGVSGAGATDSKEQERVAAQTLKRKQDRELALLQLQGRGLGNDKLALLELEMRFAQEHDEKIRLQKEINMLKNQQRRQDEFAALDQKFGLPNVSDETLANVNNKYEIGEININERETGEELMEMLNRGQELAEEGIPTDI